MNAFTYRSLMMSGAILLMALSAHAQGIASNFDQLAVLIKPGDTIRVTDSSGQEVRGRLIDLSRATVGVLSNGARREFAPSDVDRITALRRGSLATGAKWGLGVGAGFGVLTGLMVSGGDCFGCGGSWVLAAGLIYGGIGTGIGVGVSALTTHQHAIYSRPNPSVTLRINPILDGARTGLTATVGW